MKKIEFLRLGPTCSGGLVLDDHLQTSDRRSIRSHLVGKYFRLSAVDFSLCIGWSTVRWEVLSSLRSRLQAVIVDAKTELGSTFVSPQ